MTQTVRIKILALWALLALIPAVARADFNPTAYYTVDGEALETTDAITDAQAPLTVTFKANPSMLGDVKPTYEWRFTRADATTPYNV